MFNFTPVYGWRCAKPAAWMIEILGVCRSKTATSESALCSTHHSVRRRRIPASPFPPTNSARIAVADVQAERLADGDVAVPIGIPSLHRARHRRHRGGGAQLNEGAVVGDEVRSPSFLSMEVFCDLGREGRPYLFSAIPLIPSLMACIPQGFTLTCPLPSYIVCLFGWARK
ncbi:hypothetical protein B0H14DRAFT_3897756, partial [Mycena olivaceomarginata]